MACFKEFLNIGACTIRIDSDTESYNINQSNDNVKGTLGNIIIWFVNNVDQYSVRGSLNNAIP